MRTRIRPTRSARELLQPLKVTGLKRCSPWTRSSTPPPLILTPLFQPSDMTCKGCLEGSRRHGLLCHNCREQYTSHGEGNDTGAFMKDVVGNSLG
jgi:hypothetical protein